MAFLWVVPATGARATSIRSRQFYINQSVMHLTSSCKSRARSAGGGAHLNVPAGQSVQARCANDGLQMKQAATAAEAATPSDLRNNTSAWHNPVHLLHCTACSAHKSSVAVALMCALLGWATSCTSTKQLQTVKLL
jgi:hypothetical protein